MTRNPIPDRPRRRAALLFAAAATLFLPRSSPATTATWSSPASGAWFTDANWSPSDVPDTLSDTAVVTATGLGSYTLTIDGPTPLQLGTLTLSSPDVTILSLPATASQQQITTTDLYAGALTLSSAAPVNTTHTGTINNFATLTFAPGAGGTRSLGPASTLTSAGTVSVNAPTTLQSSTVHNNAAGTFSISAGQTASLTQGSRFNQNPGSTLALAGSLSLTTGSFSFAGGAITGPGTVTLTDATLALGASGSGGNFLLRGVNTTLTYAVSGGYILPTTSVTIEATNPFPLSVSLPSGITNSGTLTLRSAGGDYAISSAYTGILHNAGTFSILPGPTGGGNRDFRFTTLKNTGSVYIGSNTTFSPGSTNSGSVTVAPGATLSMGSGGSFSQSSGTLDIDGSLTLSAGQTFAYTGGSVIGTVTLNGGSVQLPAYSTPAGSSIFLFRNSGSLTQSTSTSQISPGMTVIAEANSTYQSSASPRLTLSLPYSHTNAGTLIARSVDADYDVELIAGSSFVNTGSLLLEPGPSGGGTRTLTAYSSLVNAGTVAVNADTLFRGALANSGLVSIAPGKTLRFDTGYYTFTQSAGTLDVQGNLILTGQSFAYTGGAISGTVTMDGGTLVPPTVPLASPAGTFLFRKSGTVSPVSGSPGHLPPSMTLIAEASPLYHSSASPTMTLSLLSSYSLTNAGTIILRSVGGDYNVSLDATGSSTFNSTGTILTQPGPTGGGSRTLNLNLANAGSLSINANTTLTGSLTNTGTVSIGPTGSLRLGSYTLQSAGTLDIQGSLTLTTFQTFAYTGGAILGTVTLNGGTLTLPSGPVDASAATFLFRNTGSISQFVSPTQIPSGMSIIAEANSTYQSTASPNLTLSIPFTLTNAGSLALRSADADYNVTLSGSTLINTGSLSLQPGPTGGGNRFLNLSSLQNPGGTIAVNSNTTLQGNITNSGLITIAPGKTLSQSSGSSTFSQSAGILNIQGALNLTNGQTFAYTGGSVLGTVTLTGGTLSLPTQSIPSPATFLFRGSGSFAQTTIAPSLQIPARISVVAEANPSRPDVTLSHSSSYATLTSAGSITLRSVGGNYNVTLQGNGRTLSNTGSILVEPGPSGGGPGYRVLEYGSLLNSGTLTLNTTTRLAGSLLNTGTITIAPGVTFINWGITTPTGELHLADTSSRLYFILRTRDQIRQQLLTGDLHASFPNPANLLSLAYYAQGADTILLPALTGDANLDGLLNADDFARLDLSTARSLQNPHWTDGDFNYDGTINSADYLLLDTTYAKAHGLLSAGPLLTQREAQFGSEYVSTLLASIPEPTSLFTACGLAPLLGVRRKSLRIRETSRRVTTNVG